MRFIPILCCVALLCTTACNNSDKKSDVDKDKTEKPTGKRSFDQEDKEKSDDNSTDGLIAEYTAAIDRAYLMILDDNYDPDDLIDVLAKVEISANMSAETLCKAAVTHAVGLAVTLTRLDELGDRAQEAYQAWLSDATDSYNLALTADEATLEKYAAQFEEITDIEMLDFLNTANQFYAEKYGK